MEDKRAKQLKISEKMALIESGVGSLSLNVLVDWKYGISYWSNVLGIAPELLYDPLLHPITLLKGQHWMKVIGLNVDQFFIGDWRLTRVLDMFTRLGIGDANTELREIKISVLLSILECENIYKVAVEERRSNK